MFSPFSTFFGSLIENWPPNPHCTPSLTTSAPEAPAELQLRPFADANAAHSSSPAVRSHAGSSTRSPAGSIVLQPGRAAAGGRGTCTPRGSCQTSSGKPWERSKGKRAAACSRQLPAQCRHHLGAETDRAESWVAPWLFQSHKNGVCRIPPPPSTLAFPIAITHPHLSLAQGASSELHGGTGYPCMLQRVAVSCCKGFFSPLLGLCTAVLCFPLCTFHSHFQAVQSFVLRVPCRAEMCCPSAPVDA